METPKGKILVDQSEYDLLKKHFDHGRATVEHLSDKLLEHMEKDDANWNEINKSLARLAERNDANEKFITKVLNGYGGIKWVMGIIAAMIVIGGILGTAAYEVVMALKKI